MHSYFKIPINYLIESRVVISGLKVCECIADCPGSHIACNFHEKDACGKPTSVRVHLTWIFILIQQAFSQNTPILFLHDPSFAGEFGLCGLAYLHK